MCYRCRKPATITITEERKKGHYKLCIDCAVVVISRIKKGQQVSILRRYEWITDEAYLQESVNE